MANIFSSRIKLHHNKVLAVLAVCVWKLLAHFSSKVWKQAQRIFFFQMFHLYIKSSNKSSRSENSGSSQKHLKWKHMKWKATFRSAQFVSFTNCALFCRQLHDFHVITSKFSFTKLNQFQV